MKPILCFSSWYPNEAAPFDGDFIERQLAALSLYHPVWVMSVKKVDAHFKNRSEEKIKNELKSIVFFNKQKGLLGKWKNIFLHWKFYKQYKKAYGKPKFILVQIPMKAGFVAYLFKKFLGIPYHLVEHYGIYNDRHEQKFVDRKASYKKLAKKIFRHADTLFVVSNALGEDIKKLGLKTQYTKWSNVVDASLFYYKEKKTNEKFVFLHVSNQYKVKNVDGIIDAAALLWESDKNFILKIVGAQNKEIINKALALNLVNNCIEFIGEIPYADVAVQMQKAHALIMFSNTESQSCTSLEALCCGTLVLSSRAGGIEEALNEKNAILVPIKDQKALSLAMKNVKENYNNYQIKNIAAYNIKQYGFESLGKKFYEDISPYF